MDSKVPNKCKGVATLSTLVQLAALTALWNLLVSAHPIMPRHAGKIMCELVALLVRSECLTMATTHDKDVLSLSLSSPRWLSVVWKLALHTAGMAVVVCGDPALAILDRITTGIDKYDAGVLDAVQMI